MCTASGRPFDLLKPDPEQITLEDIGHHLANLCRYTGACSPGYNVAQHCCLVASLVEPRLRFAALLHDAAEAYTNDMSSPMKAAVRILCPGLIELLHGPIEAAVEKRFGIHLSPADRAAIKHADMVALATEKRDFMPRETWDDWHASTGLVELPPPLEKKLVAWTSHAARAMFAHRVKLYTES